MDALTVHVNVPDLATNGAKRRVVGMVNGDDTRLVVASLPDGGNVAEPELSFSIGYAAALAERVLSGDQRAKTEPGLARILSATVAMLFRVSLAARALEPTEDTHGRGDHPDDRQAAPDDEDQHE